MTFADRVDPAYRDVVAALTGVVPARGGTGDVDERRAALALIGGSVAPPPGAYDVEHEDRVVPGPDDAPALRVRVYRPARATGDLPVILHVHGGGMWLGDLESEHDLCRRLSEAVGAVVVSVDYRLAPESPYPAAADDCYAALRWVTGSARELGVDAARLAVFGGSAGGGLAIATALRARDLGGPAIRLLMAVYPMVDDRHETPSSRELADLGGFVWDRAFNVEAWEWYLAGRPADAYAAPARATDLTGMPPTFVDVGELDLFRDEDVAFASALLAAGVPTELHVYPGAFHGSEAMVPDAELSRRIVATRLAALRRALAPHDA